MLNFGKILPKDRSELAKQTRARLYDEERKKRIFNPVTRTIGVSTLAYTQLSHLVTRRYKHCFRKIVKL